ncbi:MAG: branched-chain amino acid ABC transporter permease [Burkholderiales bacterium]
MSLGLLWQSILSGLTNGFVYGLVGLGLASIFRGTRIINAMQGDFALIGGITAVLLIERAGWPLPMAFVAAVLIGGIAGWLMEVALVRPLRRRGGTEDSYLLLTLGVAFAVSALVLFLIGRDSHALPGIGGEGIVVLGDAAIRTHAVWLIVLSLAVMGALRMFFSRTALGLSMLAAALDAEGASTTGINVPRMRTLTFALGGLVGGLAGILVGPLVTVFYDMGLLLTLKGFAAAILGGLANPMGAVVGGVTLGLLESLAIATVSSGYKDVIAMVILIIIMIVMPNGLLGRRLRKGG